MNDTGRALALGGHRSGECPSPAEHPGHRGVSQQHANVAVPFVGADDAVHNQEDKEGDEAQEIDPCYQPQRHPMLEDSIRDQIKDTPEHRDAKLEGHQCPE